MGKCRLWVNVSWVYVAMGICRMGICRLTPETYVPGDSLGGTAPTPNRSTAG